MVPRFAKSHNGVVFKRGGFIDIGIASGDNTGLQIVVRRWFAHQFNEFVASGILHANAHCSVKTLFRCF